MWEGGGLINHTCSPRCWWRSQTWEASALKVTFTVTLWTSSLNQSESILKKKCICLSQSGAERSNNTENGDSRLHASTHSGDAGEFRGSGGWQRGKRRRRRRSATRKLQPQFISQLGTQQPISSLPLNLTSRQGYVQNETGSKPEISHSRPAPETRIPVDFDPGWPAPNS